MMNFYGRERELRTLHGALDSGEFRVCLVYGRRRVGKSELIKQAIREKPCTAIYYSCRQTTDKNNTESLAELVAEKFGFPKPAFSGIEQLLSFLFKYGKSTPFVLVLDEYPYLRACVPGLDSILQALIDEFRPESGMKLVLCGSFVDVMKSLLSDENPLYGRIDITIHLKPMDYYDSALFYPGFSPEDKVRLYSVFGGIPYYNQLIDSGKTVYENMQELICAPGARLENEVPTYLKSEISKLNNANEVFEALSAGYSRFSDLLSQSNVSSSPMLAEVLERLMRMEIVVKQAPINDENNRKKVGYYISDGLSLFYYRYIFRYASQREVMEPAAFFNRYIRESFEQQYVPHAFETICRQYLIRKNRAGELPEMFDVIGKYYYDDPVNHKNGEFDIVTHGPEGYTFYEAKFRNEPLSEAAIREEILQVESSGLSCHRFGFFSRSGFTAEPAEGRIFIEIDEMF